MSLLKRIARRLGFIDADDIEKKMPGMVPCDSRKVDKGRYPRLFECGYVPADIPPPPKRNKRSCSHTMVVGKPQRSESHCLSHAHTINIESDYGSHSQGRERYQYSNDNDNGGCNDD